PLTTLPQFSANEYLQSIEIKNSILENVNLATFRYLTNLTFLSFMDSQALRYVYGGRIVDNLRSIKTLNFRNSSLNYLDYDIFENLPNYVKIDLSLNNFTCDCRSSALINLLISNYLNLQETFCSNSTKIYDFLANPNISTTNDCSLGYDANNGAIVKGVYGADKILDCQIFGRPTPSVAWFKYEGGKFIDVPVNDSNFDAKFIAYPDGSLKIREADRGDIGIYVCRLKNQHGNFTVYQRFRLDYAYLWWLMKIYSIICGLFVAMASFALNVISGAIRRLVVWRVSKLERTGRVRMLLESMEKYKSKQMVNLHDMYASNINQIRENYRQQLEALRRSYASQADRFRDYRTTQMENVATHLDTLRDNYNAQVNRIRDYGSKHMERVYNVYQRRVTGVRNYTLQQRLRLMRQYKLKQRYINRILENLNLQGSSGVTNIDNDETQMKKWSLKRQSGETTTDENGARKNDEDRASFHTIMSEDFQFEDKASP
uniref:Ig-like domain-containing protein n=1 Tax=Romanomermis culicivorax TaxID=13658 RepID=A0A915ID04_ROMCU